MDIAKKIARVAHIFTRYEELQEKYLIPDMGSGCFCCLDGGYSMHEYLNALVNKQKVLSQLGSFLAKDDPLFIQLVERIEAQAQDDDAHELRGFWAELLEMIEQEGGKKQEFLDYCMQRYLEGGITGACNNEDYGIEGWLYRHLV